MFCVLVPLLRKCQENLFLSFFVLSFVNHCLLLFNLWLFMISLFCHFFFNRENSLSFLVLENKRNKKRKRRKEKVKRIWQSSSWKLLPRYMPGTNKKEKKLLTSQLFCEKKTHVQTLWRFCFSYLGGFPKSTLLHPYLLCLIKEKIFLFIFSCTVNILKEPIMWVCLVLFRLGEGARMFFQYTRKILIETRTRRWSN